MTTRRAEQMLLQIVQAAQQLDSMLRRVTAHQEAFQPESVALRTQVEQVAIQLIFLSPGDYAQQAEDVLWRKVYEELQNLWQTKGALTALRSREGAYRSHLKRGVDVYRGIFWGVQASFRLDLEDYLDWTPREKPGSCAPKAHSPRAEDRHWARKFCHLCLLRIGDLYHYGTDFLDPEAEEQAGKYYYRALALIPEMGLPFLHLATLSGAKSSYIQEAYFLQCCLSSPVPHGAASLNLQLLYGKVEELYLWLTEESLPEPRAPKEKQGEDVKRLQLSFLYLHSLLQPNAATDCRLESLCQEILEKLPVCLCYLATKDGQRWASRPGRQLEDGSLLPDQMVFQMVMLCILSVQNLKLQGQLELSETATTFSLGFFAHVVHRASLRLQAALQIQPVPEREEAEEPRGPLGLGGEKAAGLPTAKAESEPSDFWQSAGKQPFSPVLPGSPTDFWVAGSPNQEDVSDLDGNCDSYDALDVSDEWADISFSSLPDRDEDDLSQQLCARKPTETPAGASSLSSNRTLDKSHLLQEKLDAFCGEGLLPTIKVIVQWLRTHPALTTLSMHTCPGLWSDLLVVLNLMPTAQELEHPDLGLGPQLQRLLPHFEQPDSPITPPLPEDVVLQGLLPLQPTQEKVNFDLHGPAPFSRDEAALRACILRTFGHFAAQLPQSLITFDSRTGLFLQTIAHGHTPPLPPPAAAHVKQAEEHREQGHLEEHALWRQLQKELACMETNLHGLQRQTALPTYLILDSLALCCYLSLVSELAHSGRFIIIIPRLVIDELDELKKNPWARQALCFLEQELQERNRYLRCQVELGPKSIRPLMDGVDALAWNLYGIVTSWAGGAAILGLHPHDVKGMGTILTALSLADPSTFSYGLKLAFSAASKAGLEIQHILTFYQQWKDCP